MGLLTKFTLTKKSKILMHNNSEQIEQNINYYTISYSNTQKAISYFIDGVWSKIYFQYKDLNEMKSHLQVLINRELVYSNKNLHIEGLNLFYKTTDSTWISECEKYGQITITNSDYFIKKS